MNTCPCCSNQLLRHIRNHRIYWFCSSCRQEMPVWEIQAFDHSQVIVPDRIPDRLTLSKFAHHCY